MLLLILFLFNILIFFFQKLIYFFALILIFKNSALTIVYLDYYYIF